MAQERTRWVLVSGAHHKAAPADALRLHTRAGFGPQVEVQVAGLERALTGRLGHRWRDLIRLASMVLAADCATSRGSKKAVDNGWSWRRSFRFVVPVHEPEFWNQIKVRRLLQDTVGFLSDDLYRFEFVPGDDLSDAGPQFLPPGNGRTFQPWDHIDEVALFSGGMDSFTGAAEATLLHGRRVMLVTRRSATKLVKVQRDLVADLRERSRGGNPWHVELNVQMHASGRTFERDNHQRSRSFLFAAIAGAVASLVGLDRFRFYENGVIAVNIPISAQLTGAQATRTVHPRVVQGFSRLLSLLHERPFVVENPYQELTRREVGERLREAGAADLLKFTRSCASVRGATTQHPHCGVCSQCVDRRFSVRAAQLPESEEAYEVDLFRDALGDDHVLLPVGYVDTADRVREIESGPVFLERYPEVATALPGLQEMWSCDEPEALARLWRLHRRQAQMVGEVVRDELRTRADDLLTGRIHPHSLLGRCVAKGTAEALRAHGVAPEPGVPSVAGPEDTEETPSVSNAVVAGERLERNTFRRIGGSWTIGLAGRTAIIDKHRRGYALIAELLRQAPRAVPTLALDRVDRPEVRRRAGVGDTKSTGAPAGGPGHQSVLAVTDAQALAAYRDRLRDLEAEIAEAEEMTDLAAVERLRVEQEFIAQQLSADTGLGGRPRQTDPDAEKARQRIKRSLNDAIRALKTHDIALGVHFQRRIERSVKVHRYDDGGGEDWDL